MTNVTCRTTKSGMSWQWTGLPCYLMCILRACQLQWGPSQSVGKYSRCPDCTGTRDTWTCIENATYWTRASRMCIENATYWTRAPRIWIENATYWTQAPRIWIENASYWTQAPRIWIENAIYWTQALRVIYYNCKVQYGGSVLYICRCNWSPVLRVLLVYLQM
jgi:hypothetical protein